MDVPTATRPDRHLLMEPPADDDAQALAALACGDLSMFDGLVNRYKDRLFHYIRHRLRAPGAGADYHQAQDITQEVFLRVFRASAGGSGYTGQASAATWLFTIANNCVTDHLRSQARRPAIAPAPLDGSFSAPANDDPFAAAARTESTERVLALLAQLPEPQREVLALKVLGDLRGTEIAEVLGLPVGTVRSRMVYGLRKIREILEQQREYQS